MSVADEPFLDLLRPPSGYAFSAGLWVTHDLDPTALTQLAVPALADLDVAEPTAHIAAWLRLPDDSLTVLYAADRLRGFGRPVPGDLVELLPVGGRRLHAKLVLLQYESQHASSGRPRFVTRAIITSANITRGGLARNREVWASIDLPSRRTQGGQLARELLSALRTMAKELTPDARDALRIRIAQISKGLPTGEPTRLVRQSLSEDTKGSLLKGLATPKPRRIVIISPPFAEGGSASLIRSLRPLLSPSCRLDIYLGTETTFDALEGGAPVAFPRDLAEALASLAQLRIYAVPSLQERQGGQQRRTLHAKVVAIFPAGSGARLLLGSANLTARGLGGRNRELMVDVWLPDGRAATAFLGTLQAREVTLDQIADPIDRQILPDTIPAPPGVSAHFEPEEGSHAGQTYVAGTLELVGDLTRVASLALRGEPCRLTSLQRVELFMERPSLVITLKGSRREVEIPVEIFAGPEFWDPTRSEDGEEGLGRGLRILQRDLSRARSRRGNRDGPHPPAGRFDLPYDRRLPDLIRYSSYLRLFDQEELHELVERYLKDGDSVEREVAYQLLASAVSGAKVTSPYPTVRALEKLVRPSV